MGLSIDTTRPVDRTGNPWCGPLVVAAVLGTSTAQVVSELIPLRRARKVGRRIAKIDTVRGTSIGELRAVLALHGRTLTPVDAGVRLTRKYTGFISPDGKRSCRVQPAFLCEPWRPWSMLTWHYPALWQFLARYKVGTFIVQLPGHWALLHDGQWCETFTNGIWCDAHRAPKQRRKVQLAYLVS